MNHVILVSGNDCVSDFKSLDDYLKSEEEKEQLLMRGVYMYCIEYVFCALIIRSTPFSTFHILAVSMY